MPCINGFVEYHVRSLFFQLGEKGGGLRVFLLCGIFKLKIIQKEAHFKTNWKKCGKRSSIQNTNYYSTDLYYHRYYLVEG